MSDDGFDFKCGEVGGDVEVVELSDWFNVKFPWSFVV